MSFDLQSEKGRCHIRAELNEELRRLCEQFPTEESEDEQQQELSLGTELVGFGTQLIESASISSIASRKRVRQNGVGLRSLGSVVPGLPPPSLHLHHDQKQQQPAASSLLPELTLEEANWFVSRLHVHKREHFLAQVKLMDGGALEYGSCSCPFSEQQAAPFSLTASSRGGDEEDDGYPQVMARMATELTRAFRRGALPILALRPQTKHLITATDADDPLILGLARLS